MLEKFYYKSPIGILEISLGYNVVLGLKVVKNYVKNAEPTDFFTNVATQLDEYFTGSRKHFNLQIQPEGTEFQIKVWEELIKIPYGETKSYQEIAEIIGNPNAQRAVGSACNKNPILLIIPCHRVIAKSGKLTGFAYGLDIKKHLLKLENINRT
ncbi:methylated-DNA--[protein]-cysteine S-methyltransferase [bacterium]|nr:methylated-DNA--[protein]-cysteine S-methyltransferase [bacterium]